MDLIKLGEVIGAKMTSGVGANEISFVKGHYEIECRDSEGNLLWSDAFDNLVPIVYDELRHLASNYMRGERPDHLLQTTALVNEAYLRLMERHHVSCETRTQFFAVAAQVMRRVLVDYARRRNFHKRGAGVRPVALVDDLDSLRNDHVGPLDIAPGIDVDLRRRAALGIPGIGRAFVVAIESRDYPMILGTTVLFSLVIAVANLVVDVAYVFIDPRVRLTD